MRKIIKDAFNKETPDLLNNIIDMCNNTTQVGVSNIINKKDNRLFRKVVYSLALVFIFVIGVFVGLSFDKEDIYTKEASIYLDVNPSIEIQVDKHNKVVEFVAGNEDGEKILNEINLKHVEVETALYAIIGSMYTNGYLNEDYNSILVSVDNYGEDNIVDLDDISVKINEIFEDNKNMECSIIAQKVDDDEKELKEKAEQYGISIGKMKLIEKIIEESDIYSEDNIEELVNMSIHELDLIYKSLVDENKDEVMSGKPNGFIEREEALNIVVDYLGVNVEELEWYDVIALYHHRDNEEREMIYLVTVIVNEGEERQRFIVNCSSGEIMGEEAVEEWKDKIPNDGHFGGPGGGGHGKPDEEGHGKPNDPNRPGPKENE